MRTFIRHYYLLGWTALLVFIGAGTGLAGSQAQALRNFLMMPLAANELGYMRLGYCSEVIVRSADKTVLFDPGSLDKEVRTVLNLHGVDLVLYTHSHYDHYSEETAMTLSTGGHPFFVVARQLEGYLKRDIPAEKLIVVKARQSYSAGGIVINTLDGDHIGPIVLFRVSLSGMKIFHGGDSAHVPMKALASQLAFVPTGAPSPTCSPDDASRMVADVRPQIAIPMHGGGRQHQRFKELVDAKKSGVRIVIAAPFEGHKVVIQ